MVARLIWRSAQQGCQVWLFIETVDLTENACNNML